MNKLNLVNALYKYNEKEVYLKVDNGNKEIYLTAKDMSKLFNKAEPNIRGYIAKLKKKIDDKNGPTFPNYETTHINSIYIELKAELPASNGKMYITNIYNSNVIYDIGLKYKPEIIMDLKEFVNRLFKENGINEISNLSLNSANNYDIVKYDNGEIILDVNVSPTEETVWLSQKQIALLFDTTVENIVIHILNIYESKELEENPTTKESLVVQMEGNRNVSRKIKLYNLDMIISIGYRVNSKRGIEFRRWATSILKSYLLKGYSISDKRCLECSESIIALNNRITELEKTSNSYKEIIFGKDYEYISEGDIPKSIRDFDRIVRLSKNNIKIIDQYIDLDSLKFLEQYPQNKKFILITSNKYLKNVELKNNFTIRFGCSLHSRYIFVDDKYSYSYTCSLNSLDKNSYELIFLDGLAPFDILKNFKK